MRIIDLLSETTSDEHHIQDIALRIVKWFEKNTNKLTGDNQKLGTIADLINDDELCLDNDLCNINLEIEILNFSRKGAWRSSAYTIFLSFNYFFKRHGIVSRPANGSRVYIADPRGLYSTLVHELRHALDDVLSNGMFRGGRGNDGPQLQRPLEINARFSQALLNIRDSVEAGADPVTAIKSSFKQLRIAEVFPNGVNDLKYRRLFNRALEYAQSI